MEWKGGREGEGKKSAVSSACWITGASCHTVRGVQYGSNYVSALLGKSIQ